MRPKRALSAITAVAAVAALAAALFFGVRARFPRPYASAVAESGVPPSLAYAVMKAESGFDETAVSGKGAIGLMQLMPETAQFVCRREKIAFFPERLTEGEYNVRIGCLYLAYLLGRFPLETAVAAYNAGEGVVAQWLADPANSDDGASLKHIPYPETERYLKKVLRFRKFYDFFR